MGRCSCGGTSGCACVIQGDGSTITVTGTGTVGSPYVVDTTLTQYTDEQARDAVGAALVEGAGIDITVSDVGDTITLASTITQYTDEQARDAIGTALVQGPGVTITVNDGGDTITIASDPITLNAQTGTTYTFVLSDEAKFVTFDNAGGITVTIPTNATAAFPIGTRIEGAQLGAGQVTLVAAGGVTLSGNPGLKTNGQNAAYGLVKLATNTWLAYGNLAA